MLLRRRLASIVRACVLVKTLLRHAVEGERGDGALQARGDNAPMALRAAPAGEVLVFSPNHASLHTNTYAWFFEQTLLPGRRGQETGEVER